MAQDLGTFARYTKGARIVVVKSQEEARATGHGQIEPGHLVLGLLHQPDLLGATTMAALGAPAETVRRVITAALGTGPGSSEQFLAYAPQTAKALDLAAQTAQRLGHDWIGAEHLLLGVLSLDDVVTVGVLSGLGVTRAAAEQYIVSRIDAIRNGG
ncbi:Clp protease N-terminal domain-containing protein [Nonomuraea fastidiosa]|jgi:ATP-dependent Clp protease ATP-binding subunit ClpA|uniref:Clp protease N-terminal domain-containing protein n=1 Tax=Nonomuraea TaxID=83681 RepID=UPI003252AED1